MVVNREDIRILIVDDEESIRITFQMFLKREGYGHITTAATLDEAMTALEKDHFDLIVSDIVLKDKSGTTLLKYIQETGIECPVVMVTGFPNLKTAAEAVRYGAFDYISKPVNKETLLRFVRQALKHRALEQERKSLQEENEKYRRYLEVIFSSVSDAIITVDDEMNIIQLNDTARRWFAEMLPQGVNNKNLSNLTGNMAEACLNDAQTVINKGRSIREHQVECSCSSGEKRMVSLTAAPLRDVTEELTGAVLVVRDITLGVPEQGKFSGRDRFHGFVGRSATMQRVYSLIENVGMVDTAVLITGESGTGKEIAAEALHAESKRKHMPLIKVDCASVQEDLLESELFGHKKGSFTGADRDRPGRLLQADKGTLFLDEIGDISPRMQLRLLRFLQEQTFTPVGEDMPIQVDVRVIAATNVDLQKKVREGGFREDLYYRLKVVEIHMPPLRERNECIQLLVHHFLMYFADKLGRNVYSVSDQAMQMLVNYSWPGNVRELRHVIERGCVMCTGTTMLIEHLPSELQKIEKVNTAVAASTNSESFAGANIHETPIRSEKETLLMILDHVGGNKSKAAKLLGIDRSTLYRKLKRYNVTAEDL